MTPSVLLWLPHACTEVCVPAHTCANITHTCMHTYMCTHTNATHMHAHTHAHTQIQLYTHVCTQIHSHTETYTQIPLLGAAPGSRTFFCKCATKNFLLNFGL